MTKICRYFLDLLLIYALKCTVSDAKACIPADFSSWHEQDVEHQFKNAQPLSFQPPSSVYKWQFLHWKRKTMKSQTDDNGCAYLLTRR